MINAMKKVLDALEREQVMAKDNNGDYTINVTPKHITEAIGDLREALSQAVEQEPVGYRYKVTTDRGDTVWTFDPFAFTPVLETQRLYTRPAPAKPLSDEPAKDIDMEALKRGQENAEKIWTEEAVSEVITPSLKPLGVEEYTEIAHRSGYHHKFASNPTGEIYIFYPHTLDDFVRKLEAAIKEQV